MQHITLITDWTSKSYYTGALKGEIYSVCKEYKIQFTDITHHITYYKYEHAAIAAKKACFHFPQGTIHLNTVDKNNKEASYIVCKYKDHIFVSPDSGFIDLVVKDKNYQAVKVLPLEEYSVSFPEISYFPAIIKNILENSDIKNLGKPYAISNIRHLDPMIHPNVIIGEIVEIDGFGNIISNITKDLHDRVGQGKKPKIQLRKATHLIEKIHNGYKSDEFNLVAFFNSTGYLEIAQMFFPAYKSLGLTLGDKIKITFS